jgi:hypothetical protein
MPTQTKNTAGGWRWVSGGRPIDIATFKAPGYYDNAELVGDGGEGIIVCGEYDVIGGGNKETRIANAQAIAAVPEMIEALKYCLSKLDATKDFVACGIAADALRKAGQL